VVPAATYVQRVPAALTAYVRRLLAIPIVISCVFVTVTTLPLAPALQSRVAMVFASIRLGSGVMRLIQQPRRPCLAPTLQDAILDLSV
jgi:hypothetical protein